MREGSWKLVAGEKSAWEPALFGPGDDLGEKHDLASAQSERVERMRAEIEAWSTEVRTGTTKRPVAAEEDDHAADRPM